MFVLHLNGFLATGRSPSSVYNFSRLKEGANICTFNTDWTVISWAANGMIILVLTQSRMVPAATLKNTGPAGQRHLAQYNFRCNG